MKSSQNVRKHLSLNNLFITHS